MRYLITTLIALMFYFPTFVEGRTFRVLYLNAPANAPKHMQVFDGTEFQEVALPKMNFSEVYQLPSGPLMLTFFQSIPSDMPEVPPEAPNIEIPELLTDFYLLVFPDDQNKALPIKAVALPASDQHLRRSQILWLNLTEYQIAGKLGKIQFTLSPQGKETTDSPINEAGDFGVSIAYRLPGNDLIYPLCNTSWRHDPRSKSVAFVIPQQDTRTPRIMVFRDFR